MTATKIVKFLRKHPEHQNGTVAARFNRSPSYIRELRRTVGLPRAPQSGRVMNLAQRKLKLHLDTTIHLLGERFSTTECAHILSQLLGEPVTPNLIRYHLRKPLDVALDEYSRRQLAHCIRRLPLIAAFAEHL